MSSWRNRPSKYDEFRYPTVAELAEGMGQGHKESTGKLQWDLLPVAGLEETIRALEFGLTKYPRGNYEHGIPYSKIFAAAMRHLWAWWRGEDRATDSNVHHLGHAAACCLMLLTLVLHQELYTEFDDRFSTPLHDKMRSHGRATKEATASEA